MLDAIIIGGGPAGLSAALILARARRRILVCDAGRPRNDASSSLNGFLSRDGIHPADLLRLGRDELLRYGVEIHRQEAIDARVCEPGPPDNPSAHRFEVTLADSTRLRSRKLLLATGVRDIIPLIDRLKDLYGVSVFHCPYCDGWEHRDQRLIAYGKGNAAVGLALNLRTWSDTVLACTDGDPIDADHRARAERNGISTRPEPVARLEAGDGRLARIHFASGPAEPADALFFNTGQYQRSPLAQNLGCRFKADGGVETSDRQCTSVPGLYLAGDADKDVQFAIVAAAEGAIAAVAINRELQDEDRGAGAGSRKPDKGR
jgi:thioredoxin reductase